METGGGVRQHMNDLAARIGDAGTGDEAWDLYTQADGLRRDASHTNPPAAGRAFRVVTAAYRQWVTTHPEAVST